MADAAQPRPDRRHEVRRHLGRRRRAHQARRRPDRRGAEEGNRVVAVLSARGKTTDELVAMAHEVSTRPDPREMDMLLSTGERISCALAAMVINDLGHEAISLTGSQAGIVTDTSHTKARILDVRADRIRTALDEGKIVLVAGFQGVSTAARRDHARPRRLGHHRGGAGGRAGRRRLRDLHRRRGRLQRRPADRARRPQAARRLLRGDARDGGLRRRRAPAALGRVRAQPRRADPLPVELRRRTRYLGPGRGQTMERPLVTAVTHSTEEARDHAHRPARQARHRRPRCSPRSPRRTSTWT